MIGYARKEVFDASDLAFLEHAKRIVRQIPTKIGGEWVRCHELARVVGEILGLGVVDGRYGAVEHSWCVNGTKILDPYVPGRFPQVQLVDGATRYANGDYRPGKTRTDIRRDVIEALHRRIEEKGHAEVRSPARHGGSDSDHPPQRPDHVCVAGGSGAPPGVLDRAAPDRGDVLPPVSPNPRAPDGARFGNTGGAPEYVAERRDRGGGPTSNSVARTAGRRMLSAKRVVKR